MNSFYDHNSDHCCIFGIFYIIDLSEIHKTGHRYQKLKDYKFTRNLKQNSLFIRKVYEIEKLDLQKFIIWKSDCIYIIKLYNWIVFTIGDVLSPTKILMSATRIINCHYLLEIF